MRFPIKFTRLKVELVSTILEIYKIKMSFFNDEQY